MELYTERLILRPWTEDDAETLYEYAKDERVGPPAGWLPHESAEESLMIIREVFSAPEHYAVVLKETGKPVGSIGFILNKDQKHSDVMRSDDAELGYWIGVPYWGQGLIPEAARELLRHGFETLALNAVWCGYFDSNTKSKRVQEKCGFIYHHTEPDKPCPLLRQSLTEHFGKLTKDRWLQLQRQDETSGGDC